MRDRQYGQGEGGLDQPTQRRQAGSLVSNSGAGVGVWRKIGTGTPSLIFLKMLVSMAAERYMSSVLLGVKCVFLYGNTRGNVYIGLPRQNPRYGDGSTTEQLKKTMHGTRGAPQIWASAVKEQISGLGFGASELHPSVYGHFARQIFVIVHVGDFLCIDGSEDLQWLFEALNKEYTSRSHPGATKFGGCSVSR